MRTLILAVAGIATAATLTACGSAAEHTDKSDDDKPSASAEGANYTDPVQGFLDELRSLYPSLLTGAEVDDAAVDAGYEVCANLDTGMSYGDLIEAYAGVAEPELAAATIVAATDYLCTEYAGIIEDGEVA